MILDYFRKRRIQQKYKSLVQNKSGLIVPEFKNKKIIFVVDLKSTDVESFYKTFDWIIKNWKCDLEMLYYNHEKVDKLRVGIQLNSSDFIGGVILKKDKIELLKSLNEIDFIFVYNPLGNPFLHVINTYLNWKKYCIGVDAIQLEWYDILIQQTGSSTMYTFIQSLDMLVQNLSKHEIT